MKKEFLNAEGALEFCWQVLADLKSGKIEENDFPLRMLNFQARLATLIFDLQSIRDKIILEENATVKNKANYKFHWFEKRMKLLSVFKKGIDNVVHLAKQFGDAFVHFFYQNNTELLNEHLGHQKVMNHTASLGELGELEFIKNFKVVDAKLTLFHGITNDLRYGDFSFYDLKEKKIVEIGELKTKKIDAQTIEFNLTLFDIRKSQDLQPAKNFPKEKSKDRRERQFRAITEFVSKTNNEPSVNRDLFNDSFGKEVNALINSCSINSFAIEQVSPGLNFTCLKFKKSSLFHKMFFRDNAKFLSNGQESVQASALKLMKPDAYNSLIVGGPLSQDHTEDHSIRGTIPIFWMPINERSLKKLYFKDVHLVAMFNPIHLIEDVEKLGFKIESKYVNNERSSIEPKTRLIQNFDNFIYMVMSYLLTEDFVLNSIKEIMDTDFWEKGMQIIIRPQQRI